jgi:hypothetical protein
VLLVDTGMGLVSRREAGFGRERLVELCDGYLARAAARR